MTPAASIARWKLVTLSERRACRQHFLGLCGVVHHRRAGHPMTSARYYRIVNAQRFLRTVLGL
jgi:hypothetical protein